MYKRLFSLSLLIFAILFFIPSCKSTEGVSGKKQEFTVDFAEQLQNILQNGTIQEALALFDTMPEKYQNDYSMNLLHGSLLVSARDAEKATIVAEKLETIEPGNVDTLLLKSMIAKLKGDKKAKSELIKAVTLKNDIPEIHYNLAYVYKCLNKPKVAQSYLDNYNKLTHEF